MLVKRRQTKKPLEAFQWHPAEWKGQVATAMCGSGAVLQVNARVGRVLRLGKMPVMVLPGQWIVRTAGEDEDHLPEFVEVLWGDLFEETYRVVDAA